MKKFIFLFILMFFSQCTIAADCSQVQYKGIPIKTTQARVNFFDTCNNCRMSGDTLTASCLTANNQRRDSSFNLKLLDDPSSCAQYVENGKHTKYVLRNYGGKLCCDKAEGQTCGS